MEDDLTCVGRDHLSLGDIAGPWSKVSRDDPERFIEALVNTAFWRGEFESGVQSALFMMVKPASSASAGQAFPLRRPGDYTISGGAIVRAGEDEESYPTAERKPFYITREHIARLFYTPRGQRGITPGEPAGFRELSFDKRDLAYPNWRAEYENAYLALSTIPIKRWPDVPSDMRDHCSSHWCIRRHDFARWYSTSTLCAGVPLDSFWPARDTNEEIAGKSIAESDRSPSKRAKNGYRHLILEAAEVVYPKAKGGIPKETNNSQLKCALMPVLRKDPRFLAEAEPKPRTFGRTLEHYPRHTRDVAKG